MEGPCHLLAAAHPQPGRGTGYPLVGALEQTRAALWRAKVVLGGAVECCEHRQTTPLGGTPTQHIGEHEMGVEDVNGRRVERVTGPAPAQRVPGPAQPHNTPAGGQIGTRDDGSRRVHQGDDSHVESVAVPVVIQIEQQPLCAALAEGVDEVGDANRHDSPPRVRELSVQVLVLGDD